MALTPLNYVNLRDGRFDGTTRSDLRRAFQAASASGSNHIVVHFHGGLVSEDAGTALAERLLPEYQQTNVCYPMFFVWKSGLLETIRINASEIANEAFFQKLLKKALAYAAGKILQAPGDRGTSIVPVGNKRVNEEIGRVEAGQRAWIDVESIGSRGTELSESELNDFKDALESDPQFMAEAEAISNSVAPAGQEGKSRGLGTTISKATLMSPEVLADMRRDRDAVGPGTRGLIGAARLIKGAIVVIARVIARFVAKRDHGLHATVVEEIFREFYVSAVGREIWALMKKDTSDAFQEGAATFGGSAFLEELAAMNPRPRLSLVGHSAGSEYVVNFIRNADRCLPADYSFDVILMAPAVRTSMFADTLTHFRRRIRTFRCFTMDDTREKADQLVKGVYPHSLLYFISGVLERSADEPILGMQRFLTGSASHYARPETGIPAVKAYLEEATHNRIFYSVCATAPGMSSDAISHGAFDDTSAGAPRSTIDSVRHILANGF